MKTLQNDFGKYVIAYLEFVERVPFFSRFEEPLLKKGYTLLYLTDKYAVVKCLVKYGINLNHIIYVHNSKNEDYGNIEIPDLSKSYELLTHQVNLHTALKLYKMTWAILAQYPHDQIKYFFIWNGHKIIDLAFKHFAKLNNIKTLYFEIANIKGKLFVDPLGTNAQSLLYKDKSVLNNFTINQNDYDNWFQHYKREKLLQTTVPQAREKHIIESGIRILQDFQGYYLKNGVVRRRIPIEKIKSFLVKKPQYKVTKNIKPDSYVFFPLQVSNDTQIIINGNMGLAEAIEFALDKAQQWNKKLIVKPHPAEINPANLQFLLQLHNDNKLEIANGNTFELIMNSYKTITINSTVGLEAKILHHPVQVIGKALYEKFDDMDVERYIQGFLINIDYFKNEKVSDKELDQVLQRADIRAVEAE